MPELPEVETIVRNCRPRLEGRRIRAFRSSWPKNCVPAAAHVRRALTGRTITRLTRRGKFIVFRLDDGGYLLVHLRMSGRFEWAADHQPAPSHVRAAWDLDDGQRLLFCDARKFGRIIHTDDFAAATADLGPEPLARSFTPRVLADLLRRRRRQLKPLLLDQSVIAGLGNIYTDEALFRARLHPLTCSAALTPAEVHRLHQAIRGVLRLAIGNHGTSLDWIYPGGWMQRRLMVYGRTGQPCRRCRTAIVALRIGQRSTHICPRCQAKR
jgi:formamidopyrimidine-DNA glycosylase